ILTNNDGGLFKFRRELIETFIKKNQKVYVSVPKGTFIQELQMLGCKVIVHNHLVRRGTNIKQDFRLILYYKDLIKKVEPNIVLTYTIKPNIYGGMMCNYWGIPYIANITGLGTSIENQGFLRYLVLFLYKQGLKQANRVFFQNEENQNFMVRNHIVKRERCKLLPGSGVNTSQYDYIPYPQSDKVVILTTIGRIMRDKGIDEILEAAEKIKREYPNTVFRLIGNFDEDYEDKIKKLVEKGVIHYIPQQKEVQSYLASSHGILHASYHEGMSNVLLEAASTGRPIIATDIPGCIEIFEPDRTGIAFKAKDTESLVQAIKRFLDLSYEQKVIMGKRGREKVMKEFDRSIVVDEYCREIEKIWR
ncbi:glycosyltransferase family 4 protein, partial [Candidatus Ventrimonas sp. KK005]